MFGPGTARWGVSEPMSILEALSQNLDAILIIGAYLLAIVLTLVFFAVALFDRMMKRRDAERKFLLGLATAAERMRNSKWEPSPGEPVGTWESRDSPEVAPGEPFEDDELVRDSRKIANAFEQIRQGDSCIFNPAPEEKLESLKREGLKPWSQDD